MDKNQFSKEEAKEVGEKLGIDWKDFNLDQFCRGLNVELEHGLCDLKTNVTGDDITMTGKIALAHLREFPDYYDRLEKLEQEAKKYWESRQTNVFCRSFSIAKRGGKL